jgi:ribonuclease P/MRP protein subunit RPP40
MVLPEEVYEIVKSDFFTELTKPTYSRVILPLSTLLEGEFFNEYVKKGVKPNPLNPLLIYMGY